jgi:hypothetical protein
MSMGLDVRAALIGLVAAAAAVGLAASMAGTASAGGGECPEKTLCVYSSDGFAGTQVNISKDGISNKLAKKINNQASSAFNNRNKRAYLYDGKNGKGDKICLAPHGEYGSLGASFDFNDLASSSKNTDNKKACPKL